MLRQLELRNLRPRVPAEVASYLRTCVKVFHVHRFVPILPLHAYRFRWREHLLWGEALQTVVEAGRAIAENSARTPSSGSMPICRWPTRRSCRRRSPRRSACASSRPAADRAAGAGALAGKRLLLVLDNCEHLLDACAALAEALLRGCPGLRVLATSREPLGIAGETAWRVPSLACPARGAPPAAARRVRQSRRSGSSSSGRRRRARLRADRRRTRPAVAADLPPAGRHPAGDRAGGRARARAAGRADRRAAGRPLPAADRRQPDGAAAPADAAGGARLEPRPARRGRSGRCFRRLAVFAGGWTLEAAEAVCAGGDGVDARREVLDLLARLVDKSLVLVDETGGGEARYRLLETVRQYAARELAEAGEEAAVRDRHRPLTWRWPSSEARAPRALASTGIRR